MAKTQPTGSQRFKRQRRNSQSCPSKRVVQTDVERDVSLSKDQLTLSMSVMSSSKIRTRKVATGFSNMKTGLTSVGTDSGKWGHREKPEQNELADDSEKRGGSEYRLCKDTFNRSGHTGYDQKHGNREESDEGKTEECIFQDEKKMPRRAQQKDEKLRFLWNSFR